MDNKDNSSGDHTSFAGISWPCIQVNLGSTTEENAEMVSTTSTAPFFTNNTIYDGANHPYDWLDFHNYVEPIGVDNNNFMDYYQEGGDFYGDNYDRRLDDISHMAVFDVTEETERNVDDFQDDFDNDWSTNVSMSLPQYTANDTATGIPPYEAGIREGGGWYHSPYGEDFVNDIKFLEDFWRVDRPLLRYAMIDDWNQKLEDSWTDSLIKRKLNRNTFNNITNKKSMEEMTNDELDDHETLMLIMDTIKIPGQINEGIRMLHEFHICRPQLDLKPYIEGFDFYLKRFIIWGLNYYFNIDEHKKRKSALSNMRAELQSRTEGQEHDAKMKKLSCKMLQTVHEMNQVSELYWTILLDWFTEYYDFKLNNTSNMEK